MANVFLGIEKFKKPTSNFEIGYFMVKFESSLGRNMSHGKNFDREKSISKCKANNDNNVMRRNIIDINSRS